MWATTKFANHILMNLKCIVFVIHNSAASKQMTSKCLTEATSQFTVHNRFWSKILKYIFNGISKTFDLALATAPLQHTAQWGAGGQLFGKY